MPATPGMFDALRVGPYLRLWLGSTVVFLGVMAQTIARSWLAFDLTGSNAALGGVLLSFGLAMIIATPFGGVVGDRLPKRAVLQFSILLLAASSAWLGFAVVFDVVAYWMLLVVGAVQAVAFALYNPARMAFITELVPPDSVPEAVTLMLINAEASRVAGPAVAGVAIGGLTYGVEAVFLSCAALFLGGAVIGLGLPAGRRLGDVAPQSPLRELRDGVRYVMQRPPLRLLLWCTLGVIMLGLPYLAFLPAVAADLFDVGSAGYGAMSAMSAVGAVATGLIVGRLRARLGPWLLVTVAGALFGVSIAALAVAPSFPVALVVLLPVGAGMLVFQTMTQSLLMSLSDLEFHGRIQGLVMLSFGGFGIVALPLGLLADTIGLRETLAAMGACVVLTTVAFALASHRYWGQSRLRDLG
ncbi:MAG: putative arabinose efflux permease, family [Frankiales bacterium]|nr:putative arabinose efflux permease, family [Frankiales bacterium]